ncbi:MAG TPA: phosphate ABC transporter substrate-binding protein PstS [Propionibacteriaceae bacterium]|nr:phosphate ABC transporter substrate-binding protein PstS [Propionibacteriaceae bacterium]
MKFSRIGAAVALSTTLALAFSGCAANEGGAGAGASPGSGETAEQLSGTLTGVGSSAMASAQETWVAQFQTANPDVTVNYSPDGSGAGRDAFAGGGADFAGSDRALDVDELGPDALTKSRCAEGAKAINLPVYISPIAVIYNLEGVDSLKLDAATVAGIFRGQITKWNDPKIAAQNEGVELPSTAITAVHRADDSGTTENFTDYLHAVAPQVWDKEADGEWPYPGGEAAPQTSGMVDAVTNGTGTIGYADASRAGDLGVAEIKVGDSYVKYSPEAASAVVDASPRAEDVERSQNDLAFELDRKASGDVYPIVLVAYAIACEKYKDPQTAARVKAYLTYIGSAEGQQAAASEVGNAPLSAELSGRVETSANSIS